jgi:Condensation domain
VSAVASDLRLTAQQEAFLSWMHESAELRHPAPVSVALRITDDLDPELLRQSIAFVVARHEALRTIFTVQDGRDQPMLADTPGADVRWIVAGGPGIEERLANARELACAERNRPFDLSRGPLLRVVVVRLGQRDHILMLAIHHLVFDSWSLGPLLRDLGFAYSALRSGQEPRESAEPVQASQIVQWSRDRWDENREIWNRALAGAPPALSHFPGRRPARAINPTSFDFAVTGDSADAVRRIAREASTTPFVVFLASWTAVLSSWSGGTDIVLRSPAAGRTLPGSETAIGCFFSSLLIRIRLADQPGFSQLLSRTRTAVLDAYRRQDYPYAEFRERFLHAPCVGYYSWRVPVHFPGLASAAFDLPSQLVDDIDTAGSDLSIPQLCIFDREGGAISARLDFNAAAFDQATVGQLADELTAYVSDISHHAIEASDV